MTSSQVQRTGLPRTVLFVDVCGSTKLYETLGNARAQAIIGKTLAILSQSATRHLGTIVKTIGDEVMCTFSSAREAADAAVDMQRSVKQAAATEEMGIKSLAVRVGFHSGPVISHAEDVFGDTVNVAARVVAHAKPGQILVAKQTVRRLPMEEGSVRFIGSTLVKGKIAPIELFEIVWEHENLTMVKDVFQTKMSNTRLTATFGDDDDRDGPYSACSAHGARAGKRVRRPRSAGLARSRQDRVPPRPFPSHRPEPERHLPADARHEGSGTAPGRNRAREIRDHQLGEIDRGAAASYASSSRCKEATARSPRGP